MRKKNCRKELLSLIISLCLLISGIGTWPIAVHAEGETQTESVIYVDGVNGLDTNDGLTDQTPLKTMKAAYGKIPNDNVATTIVVIGEVKLAPDAASTDEGFAATDLDFYRQRDGFDIYAFPIHSGNVTITSEVDSKVYPDGKLNFAGKAYVLRGNTTLTNINITSAAERLFANYNQLTLGEEITAANGVTYYPAKEIYMGIVYDTMSYTVQDAYFTMDSGNVSAIWGGSRYFEVQPAANYNVIMTINGGTVKNLYGSSCASSKSKVSVHKGIEITVNGGTVTKLYGTHASGSIGADGIKVTLKEEASVENLFASYIYTESDETYEATIAGPKVLNLENGDGDWNVLSKASGFDCLSLTNSQITITENEASVWNTVTRLEMTDDSSLDFEITPTAEVNVVAKKSGESWNTTSTLITAPAGTSNVFKLTSPVSYELSYSSEDSQTSWALSKATELSMGELTNESGIAMDIDLKLPDSTNYTKLDADATAYETYLAKMADLTVAGSGQEVPVVNPVEIKGEVAIYVDPLNGNDDNKGSEELPLKTIQKALSYVEALQTSEEPFAGIVVYLRGGTYQTEETITISRAHSGKNQIPVMISAYDNEEVVITGGKQIAGSQFKPVSEIDTNAYNKLPLAVRDEVVAVSLSELGISTADAAVTKDGSNYQVFVDGEELTLARYPNATKLALTGKVEHIGEITATYSDLGSKGTNADDPDIRFEMTDLRPTLWDNTDQTIWLHGALYAEWDIKHIRVKEANAATGIMRLDGGSTLGAKTHPDNTYYYYNILEELDVPGEFYLDNKAGILYMYPISDMSSATVTYSAMQDNLMNLTQTESVVLNGLTIEGGSGYGIYMTGCKETLVQNCILRNLGYGVRIHGQESGVIYSDIYQTANNPVIIGESEYPDFDYTAEENFLQNCYIHTTGTKNVKSGGVTLQGTGNVVSHNLLQGMYGSAISMRYLKECIIEYNEITGAPTGTYDGAAIYATFNAIATGNHVRYNYIHDIGTFSEESNPHSIYFDEGLRGNYAYGNIMSNVPSGFFTNSGSEHVIINNVVLDGREGTKNALSGSDNFATQTIDERLVRNSSFGDAYEKFLNLTEAQRSALKERYPLSVTMWETIVEAGATGSAGLFAAHGNYVHDNLTYDHGNISFTGQNDVGNNTIVESNPFTDVQNHDFSLTDSSIITWSDKLPSTDRMGILAEDKQAVSEFSMYSPMDDYQKVDPFQVLLRWTNAGGADDYEVKISRNADMSDARTYEVTARNCYFSNDEFFTYNSTYYWTTTARTAAKSRIATPVSASDGAVYSFKTMTKEEYVAMNPLDTSELEATIQAAEELLAQITEVSEDGLYEDGTYEALQEKIASAKAVMGDIESQDQVGVNRECAVLTEAIRIAETSRVVQYVTFEDLSVDDWSNVTSKELDITVEQDALKFVKDATGQAMYVPGLGTRDILCFQYKIDKEITEDTTTSWHGFALAQTNINTYAISSSTEGYFICINPTQIELQKRQDGKYTQLNKVVDTGIYSGGGYYDIEIGAINYPDGSVGIHFKINDTLIFDPEVVVDTAEDKEIEEFGAAIHGAPIVNTPTFGIVVHKNNGAEYLKPAREASENYTAGLSVVDDTVTVGETVNVNIAVGHSEDEKFAAGEVVISYDSAKLSFNEEKFEQLNEGVTVKEDSAGTLTLEDYGKDKNFGNAVYVLAFDAKADGEAKVKITSAAFVNKEDAVKSDLIAATISPAEITLTVNKTKHNVTLPEGFTGDATVTDGEAYTFSVSEDGAYFEYGEVTATVNGVSVDVTKNPDGTYTIAEVTGVLVISGTRTAKSFDVTIEGTGANDIVGAASKATYGTDYTFTMPTADGFAYQLESLTIGGVDVTDESVYEVDSDTNQYTIRGSAIKGAIVMSISKTATKAGVTVTGSGASAAAGYNVSATIGADYTLTIVPESGWTYVVTATMNGETAEVIDNENNTYTIKDVTGPIVFTVERILKVEGIEVTDYLTIDGSNIWLVKNAVTVDEGKVPTYDNNKMFWSDKYQAYCYLVIAATISADDVTGKVNIANGTAVTVDYGMDVNMSGKVDASDAQLTYNIYNAMYSEFTQDVTVEKFLRADVNGDAKVNVEDAAAIITYILEQ